MGRLRSTQIHRRSSRKLPYTSIVVILLVLCPFVLVSQTPAKNPWSRSTQTHRPRPWAHCDRCNGHQAQQELRWRICIASLPVLFSGVSWFFTLPPPKSCMFPCPVLGESLCEPEEEYEVRNMIKGSAVHHWIRLLRNWDEHSARSVVWNVRLSYAGRKLSQCRSFL